MLALDADFLPRATETYDDWFERVVEPMIDELSGTDEDHAFALQFGQLVWERLGGC